MNPRRLAFLLILVSAALLSRPFLPTASGDEWQPIDPADLKMTSEPKAPGAPAIFLYRQVDRKDATRAGTEYNYVRIKILTEEGRQYANVEIPYYRQDASVNISNIRARTIRPDGTVINFDGKVYDKIIEKTKGTKIRAKTFSIPDVQVGSIVEYHFNYDFEDYYIFNSYWAVSDQLFTRFAKFSLKPFPEWGVRWAWPAGLPAGTVPPKQEPDNIVRMTAHDIPALEVEDYMPPENELKFRVLFIYSEDGFEQDPVKYWRKFGKKRNDSLESFVNKRKDLESFVSGVVSPNDSQEVKLRKIYARVQQLRNLSYEPRKSAEEEKRDKQKKIENAADILKNGYGSGKDLTWLFVGLARAAGFEASGAFVATRDDYFFQESRMNSDELNSNVAVVKVDGKDLFLDPGSAFVPYGLLPWMETGVKGLKLNKDGGVWVETPLPLSADSQITRKADFKITDDGSLEGRVIVTYTGLEACSRRQSLRNQDAEARKKYLEDAMKDYVPATVDVDLKNQPDWTSSEKPLVAEYEVKIPGWVSSAGRRALMPAGIFCSTEKRMFEHANRVNAVYFHYPHRKTDDVTVELPPGWKIGSVPKPEDQDAKAAEYTLTVEQKPGAVHVTRVLRNDLLLLQKEYYSTLRSFFLVVKSSDEKQIVFEPGAAAANN
ncbi:MAG TPA: DUF3857 domain-containing protein [Candidatus Acidoferrum sp.]|nr:DUF3857 domain-containing protein [Candidatus Acidoferrum sp.]